VPRLATQETTKQAVVGDGGSGTAMEGEELPAIGGGRNSSVFVTKSQSLF
jgi:hypothetical protein